VEGDVAWLTVTAPAGAGTDRRPDSQLSSDELDLNGLVAELCLEVVDEAFAVVGLPRLKAGRRGGDSRFMPLGEARGVKPSSRLMASRVSSLRRRGSTLVLRRLDVRSHSVGMARAVALSALCSLRRRRRLISRLPHGAVHRALKSRRGVLGDWAVHQPNPR